MASPEASVSTRRPEKTPRATSIEPLFNQTTQTLCFETSEVFFRGLPFDAPLLVSLEAFGGRRVRSFLTSETVILTEQRRHQTLCLDLLVAAESIRLACCRPDRQGGPLRDIAPRCHGLCPDY